jgi:Ca2+-binding RTX toxin-like protein
MTIKGTHGNDNLTGTGGNDIFNMAQGGTDTADGAGGNDTFNFGGAFDAGDQVIGGTGNDVLSLNGDYSGAKHLLLTALSLNGIEQIRLSAGHSYDLTLNDANVVAGQTLTLHANSLGAADSLIFHGQSETDGNLKIVGGAGNDTIYAGGLTSSVDAGGGNDKVYSSASHGSLNGGGGDDLIQLQAAGTVSVKSGTGNDRIIASDFLNAADKIDGGDGNDEVDLSGNGYANGFVFHGSTITHVETLFLDLNSSYNLTMSDGNVAAGEHMDIDGDLLQNGHTVFVDASHETDGTLFLGGGAGNDTLVGGQAGNTISGGGGQDMLTTGAGADVFLYYNTAADSTGMTHDIIKGFDASQDSFNLPGTVSAVDTAITAGTLRAAHFDADLTVAADAVHLATGHAVLFTASAGGLAGHTFLVVDANGTAGYQGGGDYVMELASAQHLGSLDTGNFI